MRVVRGCALMLVPCVIINLSPVTAAHTLPIDTPTYSKRSPRPPRVLEYSERTAEQYSANSARRYPGIGTKDQSENFRKPPLNDRQMPLSVGKLDLSHLGWHPAIYHRFSPAMLFDGSTHRLSGRRRRSSQSSTEGDDTQADLCWKYPVVCYNIISEADLPPVSVPEDSSEPRPQELEHLAEMRPLPSKRYLGIELPDYIATRHTSLRATNSHYLARINQLKQRMRHVGK